MPIINFPYGAWLGLTGISYGVIFSLVMWDFMEVLVGGRPLPRGSGLVQMTPFPWLRLAAYVASIGVSSYMTWLGFVLHVR